MKTTTTTCPSAVSSSSVFVLHVEQHVFKRTCRIRLPSFKLIVSISMGPRAAAAGAPSYGPRLLFFSFSFISYECDCSTINNIYIILYIIYNAYIIIIYLQRFIKTNNDPFQRVRVCAAKRMSNPHDTWRAVFCVLQQTYNIIYYRAYLFSTIDVVLFALTIGTLSSEYSRPVIKSQVTAFISVYNVGFLYDILIFTTIQDSMVAQRAGQDDIGCKSWCRC